MSQIYGKLFDRGELSPSHLKIIELVGSSKKVLELGSSTGYLTRLFKKNSCLVDIVEQDKEDAKKAKKYAGEVFIGSLDDKNFFKKISKKYDVIVAADVLEHLKYPDKVLISLKENLNKSSKLIISLPNIATWSVRRDLFFKGNFEYTDSGILDKTHLKFFSYSSIQKFLKSLGYKVLEIYPMQLEFPFQKVLFNIHPKVARFFGRVLGYRLLKLFPNLFSAHLIIVCKKND